MEKPPRVFQLLILTIAFFSVSAFASPQNAPNSAGWYTTAQAANGAKAYQKTCASCHGATLHGGMGPALVG
jgi:mono/diheme cytochrome c family protein